MQHVPLAALSGRSQSLGSKLPLTPPRAGLSDISNTGAQAVSGGTPVAGAAPRCGVGRKECREGGPTDPFGLFAPVATP